MELIGRQEELKALLTHVEKDKSGTVLVYGLPGAGKSSFLRESSNKLQEKAGLITLFHRIRSPLNCPQAFLKQIFLQITNSPFFNAYEPLKIMQKSGGSNLPADWAYCSKNHYLQDGLIFHLFLNALAVKTTKKIVLFIDQAELLSPESRTLLRLLSEWRANGVFFIFSVSNSNPGIEGIQQDFGIDFFHKGAKNLNIRPLSDIYANEFMELYGINTIPGGWHFMDCALLQKRIWLLEQAQNNEKLRAALQILAGHPSGLPCSELSSFDLLHSFIQETPLLKEIIDIDDGFICFNTREYSEDLLRETSFNTLEEKPTPINKQHDQYIVYALEQYLSNGKPIDDNFLKVLLLFYLKTASITNLGEICAMQEALPPKSSHKNTINVIEQLMPLFFAQTTDEFTDFIPPDFSEFANKPEFSSALFRHLYVCCKNLCASELFFSLCPILTKISKQDTLFFIRPLLHLETEKMESALDGLKRILPEYADNLIEPLQKHFRGELKLESIPAFTNEKNDFKILFLFLKSIENSDETEKMMSFLNSAHTEALQDGQFVFMADILNNLSHCHERLGNFDQQLFHYREAVIFEQFS